jgi:hypothetical protein
MNIVAMIEIYRNQVCGVTQKQHRPGKVDEDPPVPINYRKQAKKLMPKKRGGKHAPIPNQPGEKIN